MQKKDICTKYNMSSPTINERIKEMLNEQGIKNYSDAREHLRDKNIDDVVKEIEEKAKVKEGPEKPSEKPEVEEKEKPVDGPKEELSEKNKEELNKDGKEETKDKSKEEDKKESDVETKEKNEEDRQEEISEDLNKSDDKDYENINKVAEDDKTDIFYFPQISSIPLEARIGSRF